jgi:two-component system, response regulator / RNA-binding antiterminator
MLRATGDPPSVPHLIDIIVAMPCDENADALIRELQRTRSRVRHLWPIHDRLLTNADVLFCELSPTLPSAIPWTPGEPAAALVIAIPGPSVDLDLLRRCAPDAVLHRPYTRAAVTTSLCLARDHFTYQQRLRSRIGKLDETLRGIRKVERAKTILMTTRQMAEEDAYNFMRSQAMTKRVSISAVAAAIVDSHEVLN